MSNWDLFSSHGLVLIFFARNPRARLRDAAEAIGITERAVQNNIRDLSASGHLIIEKVGRCNRYKVMGRKHLPHPTTRSVPIRQLLRLFKANQTDERAAEAVANTGPAVAVTKSPASKKKAVSKAKPVASPKVDKVDTGTPSEEKVEPVVEKKLSKPKKQDKKKDSEATPKLPQQDLLF